MHASSIKQARQIYKVTCPARLQAAIKLFQWLDMHGELHTVTNWLLIKLQRWETVVVMPQNGNTPLSPFDHRSQLKRENPLDLSILIRGGKETNKDSPSNGEWSGKSSSWKSLAFGLANCGLETFYQRESRYKSLETGYHRGWESRLWSGVSCVRCSFRESCCLGVQH